MSCRNLGVVNFSPPPHLLMYTSSDQPLLQFPGAKQRLTLLGMGSKACFSSKLMIHFVNKDLGDNGQ